jgi:hypothetical protein
MQLSHATPRAQNAEVHYDGDTDVSVASRGCLEVSGIPDTTIRVVPQDAKSPTFHGSVRPGDSPERAPDSLADQGSYRPPLGKSGEGLEVSFALPWSYGRVPGFVHTTTPSNPASTIASGSDSPRQSEQSISGSVTTESVSPNRRLTMLQYTSQLNSFEELMFENIWACPGAQDQTPGAGQVFGTIRG